MERIGLPKITRPISAIATCYLLSWTGITDGHTGIFSALCNTAFTSLRYFTDINTFVWNKEIAPQTNQSCSTLPNYQARQEKKWVHLKQQPTAGSINVNPTVG